jgi:hypothetical protein
MWSSISEACKQKMQSSLSCSPWRMRRFAVQHLRRKANQKKKRTQGSARVFQMRSTPKGLMEPMNIAP